MSRIKNLIGQKFGKLTVIERAEDYVSTSGKSKRVRWLCNCDCGNTIIVRANDLTSGNTSSCGCFLNESRRKYEDLTGKKFGNLTVLHVGERKIEPSGRQKIRWVCQCDCGKIKEIYTSSLKDGTTKSCGCYQKKITSKTCTKNLIGKRFGMLTVIDRAESHIQPNGKRRTMWVCKCDCGNIKTIQANALQSGQKSCGCMQYPKRSDSLVGRKFGNLTVIKRLDDTFKKSGQKQSVWLCQCDCGEFKEAKYSYLKNEHSKSCGCLFKKNIKVNDNFTIISHLENDYYSILFNNKQDIWTANDIKNYRERIHSDGYQNTQN